MECSQHTYSFSCNHGLLKKKIKIKIKQLEKEFTFLPFLGGINWQFYLKTQNFILKKRFVYKDPKSERKIDIWVTFWCVPMTDTNLNGKWQFIKRMRWASFYTNHLMFQLNNPVAEIRPRILTTSLSHTFVSK